MLSQVPELPDQVAGRVGIEFHGVGGGDVDWESAFQVRSAYRNEADFRITNLRTTSSEDGEPRIARIIDRDESVSKNYERTVWKRLQDLDRDAPEEVTIGAYRRESLGDLQKALSGLFSDPGLLLQDFGGTPRGFISVLQGQRSRLPLQESLRRRKGGVRCPPRRVREARRGKGGCLLH